MTGLLGEKLHGGPFDGKVVETATYMTVELHMPCVSEDGKYRAAVYKRIDGKLTFVEYRS